MVKHYSQFLDLMRVKIPSLYAHLHRNLALPPAMYLEPLLKSMFVKHLPLDIAMRLWDVIAFKGDKIIFQVVLGLMMIMESSLFVEKENILQHFGWDGNIWDIAHDEDVVIQSVRQACI